MLIELSNPEPHPAMALPTHEQTFHPLGFPVHILTNDPEVLNIATTLWHHHPATQTAPPVQIQILVSDSTSTACPPAPFFHGRKHLLSLIADPQNHITCDLRTGFGFACITRATLAHRLYFQYHFLEAIALALISATHAPALHAACVSLNHRGSLLCGPSGAGKSTLAYACARAGFTYITDDASYLLRHADPPRVVGHSHKIRFRPHSRELFPELHHRELTPRLEGKPSIEIPTSELSLTTAPEAIIHHIILLDRHPSTPAQLTPVSTATALHTLHDHLYPAPEIRRDQIAALQHLQHAQAAILRYSSLDDAVRLLTSLAQHS